MGHIQVTHKCVNPGIIVFLSETRLVKLYPFFLRAISGTGRIQDAKKAV